MSNSSSSHRTHRPRVLWLAKGLGTGGMEQLLVTQARLGDHTAFDYSAAYVIERPNSVASKLTEHGVPVTKLGADGRLDWISHLRRHLRENRIDVVHSHSPIPAVAARLIARLTTRERPVTLYTEHNVWGSHKTPTRIANAITYPLDTKQLAVSEGAIESIPKVLRRKISVLTHGIDIEDVRASSEGGSIRTELGISDGSMLCVTVANLRRQKAYDIWLEAAAQLVKAGVDATFISVGQGPLEAELAARRDELNLPGKFHFLGHRGDIPAILGASDVFVLPSRHEGLPLALMEAMAVGLPMIVTGVGGIPEYVTNEKNGLIIEPESTSQLVEAVRRFADDAALRSSLGRAAFNSSDIFDATHAVKQIEEMYRASVANKTMQLPK